ncbi:hypothetical protein [Streptomyces bottropensis]|uniref:hypothetical protein n=2 Tax=Streptomyces bottropensis TaxID=42235 RepID=UPI00368770B7
MGEGEGVDARSDRPAAVALLTPVGEGPEEAAERKAGMHHDQHRAAGRSCMPTYAKVEKGGTAVLRYEVANGQDPSVKDFLRTYDITARPKRTSPSEVTYRDYRTRLQAGQAAQRSPGAS